MKTMKNNLKYILMGILCMGIAACTNDSSDEPNPVLKDEISRSTITIERTVTLTTPGTLQEELEKVIDDVSTLQKLTFSGPYNGIDVEYWKTNLINLIEFDLKDAEPTYTENDIEIYDDWGNTFRQGDDEVMGYSFANMVKLEKLVFPINISYIPFRACDGCVSLTSVDIPESVSRIEYQAFGGCGFTSFTVSSNLTDLQDNIFINNQNLENVTIEANIDKIPYAMFDACSKLKNIELPSSVVELGGHALSRCGFTEFTIPSTIKIIGSEAFDRCESLTKVTLNEGLESIGYCAFRGVPITEINIPSTVTELAYGAFESTQLREITIPETVTSVGGTLFNYCHALSAIIWNSPAEVADVFDLNPNCYLYLDNDKISVGPNWKNIVVKIGDEYIAESITLCEGGQRENANMSYSVPKEFTAKKITYERYYDNWWTIWTYPGECSGWQTIVLPFTPTKIECEDKGEIAPFNSGIEGAKPFWLRELTAEGWKDRTTMEPNKAYIIAMPNHDSYMEEYRLYGKITFSAEDVELEATIDETTQTEIVYPASVGPEYDLQPTYQFVGHGPLVYALNTNYGIDGHQYGSVFARSSSDVYAFEAYVYPGGRLARSAFGIDTSSSNTRSAKEKNTTGIPQIGDM